MIYTNSYSQYFVNLMLLFFKIICLIFVCVRNDNKKDWIWNKKKNSIIYYIYLIFINNI